MIEKKTLTEKDINELSEKQLNKVSGGYSYGDTCPDCGNYTLLDERDSDLLYCPGCGWKSRDVRSNAI